MEQKLKLIGIVAMVFGVLATVLSFFPFGIFFALLSGFIGMIVSGIYIGIDTRNEINQKKITLGVIAMILSSVPILIMLSVVILSKINS